jgi:cardiolipin synthase A/B
MNDQLVSQITDLITDMPLALSQRICDRISLISDWEILLLQIPSMIPAPEQRKVFQGICRIMQVMNYSPAILALIFSAATAVEGKHHDDPLIELVWSGPHNFAFSMRRTDEALLHLIASAQHTLYLSSYVFYQFDSLQQALIGAIEREVSVNLFLEIDKLKNLERFNRMIPKNYQTSLSIFTWPRVSQTSMQGVFHAKVVISDNRRLLVSSANLTESAMLKNIELGLLVTGGDYAGQARQIFDVLIAEGIFTLVDQ